MGRDNGLDFSKENKDIIIEDYINMIYNVAGKYRVGDLETEDLIQELCMKYMQCVKKYDRTTGIKFSTYLYKALVFKIHRMRNDDNRHRENIGEYTTLNSTYINDSGDKRESIDFHSDSLDIEKECINQDTMDKAIPVLLSREYGFVTLERVFDNKKIIDICKENGINRNKYELEDKKNMSAIRSILGIREEYKVPTPLDPKKPLEVKKQHIPRSLTRLESTVYNFRLNGLTPKEIAEKIGNTPKNVKATIYRMRKKLIESGIQ